MGLTFGFPTWAWLFGFFVSSREWKTESMQISGSLKAKRQKPPEAWHEVHVKTCWPMVGMRVLSRVISASESESQCEPTWSARERIHSKVRNRPDPAATEELVTSESTFAQTAEWLQRLVMLTRSKCWRDNLNEDVDAQQD
jgi:hypothetical protein